MKRDLSHYSHEEHNAYWDGHTDGLEQSPTCRRERIATAALQGLLAYPRADRDADQTITLAVGYADHLIAALDAKPEQEKT